MSLSYILNKELTVFITIVVLIGVMLYVDHKQRTEK